jgi:hypothetical protein
MVMSSRFAQRSMSLPSARSATASSAGPTGAGRTACWLQPRTFDADATVWYATIAARRDHLGLPIDGFDAQTAAISRTPGAALATRNAKDFRETGIDVTDPWQ